MKDSHEHFLRECLGDSAVGALNKAIGRQGHDGGNKLEDTYMSLMVVPRALLSWVSATLRGMQAGGKLETEVPGGSGAKMLVNKLQGDDYKGYIHRDGEIIHRFEEATIPALSGHLMTVLELYDDFEDSHEDSPSVINDLIPLIDKMVEAKIQMASQPVINVNINNGKESQPIMTPTLPVMKKEPKAVDSNSFKIGYHAAMGNHHREKGEKDKAYQHDKKIDKCIKSIGTYSEMDKSEFAAGADRATSRIEKGEDDEGCGCEEKTDQYRDEQEKLKDEKQQEDAKELESDYKDKDEERDPAKKIDPEKETVEKGENAPPPPTPDSKQQPNAKPDVPEFAKAEKWKDKLDGGLADKKTPKNFDSKALSEGVKVEMEHTKDKKIATEIAMDHLAEDPGYYKALKQIHKSAKSLSKADLESRCPDCGGVEFVDDKFVGCICMADMADAKLSIAKNEKGEYELKFGKGWDQENIELLLEILRRRNA